jgi:hypothetical protein
MPYGTINADLMTTSDGVSSSGLYGFKNRIINGAMVIDQRNAGASVTPANNAYTLDRWRFLLTQASKLSTQQSTTAPAGFNNSMLVTSLSAYSVASGDTFNIQQFIEGFNFADLGWGTANAQPVTLSFRVYSSLTGTFGGSIVNSAIDRSYPFSYSIPVANTWTTVSVTIAGDTSGTWVTNSGIGARLSFSMGTGATYNAAAGAWAAGYYLGATGATSVVGTNGATFYITGVQLEKGSTATSFDYRPYGTELQLCQRYFELFTQPSAACLLSGEFAGAGNNSLNVFYKQTKRAVPTVTAPIGWTNATPSTAPSIDVCAFQAGAFFYMNGSAGATVLTFSSEL